MPGGAAFFGVYGEVVYDGGDLLRRLCFILSDHSKTSITYWLELPLSELVEWIATNNDIIHERNEIYRKRW